MAKPAILWMGAKTMDSRPNVVPTRLSSGKNTASASMPSEWSDADINFEKSRFVELINDFCNHPSPAGLRMVLEELDAARKESSYSAQLRLKKCLFSECFSLQGVFKDHATSSTRTDLICKIVDSFEDSLRRDQEQLLSHLLSTLFKTKINQDIEDWIRQRIGDAMQLAAYHDCKRAINALMLIDKQVAKESNVHVFPQDTLDNALLLAASRNRGEIVEKLLKCGASPHAEYQNGSTLVSAAEHFQNTEMIKAIEAAKNNLN